ncbi:glycoside hydrolase family 2 protein [Pseudomassariella vexata]|uniref:Glycoside hydrolase family 2 protein n=1 Tax=Pseudomassariella vexata TaxID=1141098 RepID=A0A1Y2DLZ3_9PEZI|nr:glycoside hydrolase family 2 protein [Pseudomassariella vexata]ORY60241.1 glycoside hydrolase family 2 protein [Pseudomassariella vexata]
MNLRGLFQALMLCCESVTAEFPSLPASGPSQSVIPSWHIQSSSQTSKNLSVLSKPRADVSSWHHVSNSKCTLMGCLIEAGVYDDKMLFFSDNLYTAVDRSQFSVPWLYRHEFALSPRKGQHYFLETNGITSKADVFFNGHQIANRTVQAGAYAGHRFEVTKLVEKENAVLVRVYPTDYDHDFALGFVDWNPYPPDNGTGVWRDVLVKRTGPVALAPLSVVTDFELPVDKGGATVMLKAAIQNLEDHHVTVVLEGKVSNEAGGRPEVKRQVVRLGTRQSLNVSITTTLDKPAIWWPKAWGEQPLYDAQLSVLVDNTVSDIAKRTFGIRQVTSKLNEYNDTLFSINGHPFQVIGGGYSADVFLRWDSAKFTAQAQYMLDLGHNTVRLEGKMEHPELYDIADRMGLMVMAGWECCNKWEAWTYNDNLAVKDEWDQSDYGIANASMRHEAAMIQSHPSMLAFLVGSDYWPDDQAAGMYVKAFEEVHWQNPIVASASKQGHPEILAPSGMKMAGPYDWVPPNYWYDTNPDEDRLGAAFGLGSELGAGVGTPELSSLKKFLTPGDMDDLWKQPNKGLFHMSTNVSSFYTREIYNDALWKRYGPPTSLGDYLLKAQVLDYEATRAQFEGYAAFWNAEQPATGLIYWMLNNAWPSLHWNLFDYYLQPAGSYFGAKVGGRLEHVAYDYVRRDVYLINHSLDRKGPRTIEVEAIGTNGKVILSKTVAAPTEPNRSKSVYKLPTLSYSTDVIFLRLLLSDNHQNTLSRNVYWLPKTPDTLDWDNSTWYHTPVAKYSDLTSLSDLPTATVSVMVVKQGATRGVAKVLLNNKSSVPAFFLRISLVDRTTGEDIASVFWSDNYVTLWPHERMEIDVRFNAKLAFGGDVELGYRGWNVEIV